MIYQTISVRVMRSAAILTARATDIVLQIVILINHVRVIQFVLPDVELTQAAVVIIIADVTDKL